ncbi:hypothetical protein H1R20_g6694, partial [Candolleomyces eurysporus]
MASRWNANQRSTSRASDHTAASLDSPLATRSRTGHGSSIHSVWSEPAPLDDSCAKYVLSVMVLFLRQTTSYEVPLMLNTPSADLSFRDFELHDTISLPAASELQDEASVTHTPPEGARHLRSQPSSSSMRSMQNSIGSASHFPTPGRGYEKTHLSLVKNSGAVSNLIAKYTGRIIFHISATNWSVVYNRMRTKIRFLGSHPDESPDTVDLQLMAHSILTRHRLVNLLNDLSSLLVNMGKESQLAIAMSLRTAVWNWIDRFPQEFNEAIRTRGRMEGAPERVFDLLFSITSAGHERIFWPCLTMLTAITHERISSDFQTASYGTPRRKEQRLGHEVMKHIRSSSKLSDISLACAVDMCRVAAYLDGGDDLPLAMVASDVAHEIKGALYNMASRKAFWDNSEEIDVALYADALVAIFRFMPEEDSIPIFMECIEPERSEAVKTCVIRATLTLVNEASRLPSQKSLDRLRDSIARRFRDVLKSSAIRRPEIDQYGNSKRIASRPRGKRTTPDPLSDKDIMVLAILSMWRSSQAFLNQGLIDEDLANLIAVTTKLWDSPLDICVKISAASLLSNVTTASFSKPPKDESDYLVVESLRQALPRTLISVGTNLLNERTDVEAQKLWISLAHHIVDAYSKKIDMEHVKTIQRDPYRIPAVILGEIALMAALPSANVDMSHLAAKGLRLISLMDSLPNAPISVLLSEEETSKRNFIYEQLGDPNVVLIGRVGHQRRIRKLIRLISFNSPAHPAVWAECYSRWRAISQPVYEVLNQSLDGTDAPRTVFSNQQELRAQWQNLTLFLATLCGACTWDKQESTSLLKAIPSELLPDKLRSPANVPALAETFISDLINLLMHQDALIRDTAREALGSELSPKFYAKLIRFMDDHMRGIEQGAGPRFTDDYLLFLDQFLTVLRLLAEDKQGSIEDVMSVDVSSLMHSLAEFIARYDEPASHRIKIKFCQLCKSICERTDILTMRKDNALRHDILDIVLEWLQPSNMHVNGNEQADLIEPTLAELNMACLRTATKLLERLQLRPTDVAHTGDETVHVILGVFKRYSDRLLQCLDKGRYDVPTSDSASELGSVHQRMRVSQKEAELRELVITGLTHLVSANSESGFKQCLHLAYDPDPRKRTIFAHVFARVIGEGTNFETPERPSPMNRQARFAELLRGYDVGMVLAMTMCEICPPAEVEIIINVLLNVFDSHDSLVSLLKLTIEREIAHTADSETALFRSNSTCTRLLSAFARIHGYAFLRNLIKSLIAAMVTGSYDLPYPVDPRQVPPQDIDMSNDDLKVKGVDFVISMIDTSVDHAPSIIREIAMHIARVVSVSWPDAKNAALGAFIFLRFISPAIVTPEIIDIELPKEHEAMLRKGLMRIGKDVQMLANHVFFGKELPPTMHQAHAQHNGDKLIRFLEELQRPAASPTNELEEWSGATDDTDVIVLHRFFDKHADKIGKELLSLSKPSPDGDTTAVNGKRAWDGLCALLVDLGTPLEVPKPSPLQSTEHPVYRELMEDFAGRNNSRVRDLFVEIEVGVNEPSLFVFKLSKIDVEDLDIQLLMYHIFKTLTQSVYVNIPFDIVVDCTGFSPISELPLHWLKYCAEVLPADLRNRFRTAHILNPNYLMQKYLRRLYNVSAGTAYCSECRAYTSVEDMLEYVPDAVLAALSYPVSTEQELPEMYEDVTLKVLHTRVPVEVAVSSTHLRVTTRKPFPVTPSFSCKYVEIIPLSEVLDVYNIMNQEQAEFLVRRRHTIMYFTSNHRDAIVKHVRTVKGKLKDAPAPLAERFARFSNVPATLLHIGFLSVDPYDDELRAAAYDLLGAVCTYLKYDQNPIVARKAGFIPGDPFAFVIQMSEKLSDFAPRLTLDFIREICAAMSGMPKDAVAERISCLHYMSPWIRNLSHFASPTSELFEKSGARLRDCVRTLTDLSIAYPEIISTLQKCVWTEMAKLDSFVVDIILDELVRTAIDGGIGTRRCEIICQVGASLSSINVRSRMYARLRKALGRNPVKVVNTLTAHQNWSEISTLVRLLSSLGPYAKHPGPNQLFVPEVFHLVTLTIGEGPALVRKSVYGIIINLLQALYVSRTDDISGPEILRLIDDCSTPATLKLFGLMRETPTSEYTKYNPASDKEHLDNLEAFVQLLLRIGEVASGSRGLLNIWRARWMSLVTATAFQISPVVQARSFVSLGALATSEVDDDFIYQIMVSLKTSLTRVQDNCIITIVSMLRCLCKLAPALEDQSRYVPLFFWLGVSLLQAGHPSFFEEASSLLTTSLELMEKQGLFRQHTVSSVLLEHRLPLDSVTQQLDDILGISFDSNFSIALAHIIFKGVRHSALKDSAEIMLRCLLQVTVRSDRRGMTNGSNKYREVLSPEVLGYFLALLPFSSTTASYSRLLKESGIDDAWHVDAGLPDPDRDDTSAPRLTTAFLNINDPHTALLVATVVGTMLGTAQGDDAETEMLYGLLAELAMSFPDIIYAVYESVRERIRDTFANSSNATIIRSVSTILRVHVSLQQDSIRYDRPRGSSQSTLNDRVEDKTSASGEHLAALDELGMRGLAYHLTFLLQQEAREGIISWIKNLVDLIYST